MDKPSAKLLLYDEAIYIHQGNQYIVKKLDLENQPQLVTDSRREHVAIDRVETLG